MAAFVGLIQKISGKDSGSRRQATPGNVCGVGMRVWEKMGFHALWNYGSIGLVYGTTENPQKLCSNCVRQGQGREEVIKNRNDCWGLVTVCPAPGSLRDACLGR